MITELEFQSLAAEGYNRIPLISEAFADLETPLSLYLKLCAGAGQGRYSFLLESVVGGERFGRYSFIGLPARTVLRSQGQRTEVRRDGEVVEESMRLAGRRPVLLERAPEAISVRNPDNGKARTALGWRPAIDLRMGLATLQPVVAV